jgi:hypothetical protein
MTVLWLSPKLQRSCIKTVRESATIKEERKQRLFCLLLVSGMIVARASIFPFVLVLA